MDEGIEDAIFSDDCEECDDNCKTCFLDADRCQSCYTGYRLKGNKCVGRFSLEMLFKLDIDYEFFVENEKAQELLELIASILGIDLENVDLVSLYEGSTNAQVSSDSTTQSGAAALGDNTGAVSSAVGSNIARVISSSSAVYYDDSEI